MKTNRTPGRLARTWREIWLHRSAYVLMAPFMTIFFGLNRRGL